MTIFPGGVLVMHPQGESVCLQSHPQGLESPGMGGGPHRDRWGLGWVRKEIKTGKMAKHWERQGASPPKIHRTKIGSAWMCDVGECGAPKHLKQEPQFKFMLRAGVLSYRPHVCQGWGPRFDPVQKKNEKSNNEKKRKKRQRDRQKQNSYWYHNMKCLFLLPSKLLSPLPQPHGNTFYFP